MTGGQISGAGPHHVVVGDPAHGVTRLGLQLLAPGTSVTTLPAGLGTPEEVAAARSRLPAPAVAPALHAHLTDGLLGPDPAGVLAALRAGRRLALTLHDIPQPAEGDARFARRSALYRELAAMAELVLVCSAHERDGLLGLGVQTPIEVVDHPIDSRHTGRLPSDSATVGLLGWIYPGKGHDRVLQAMATAMPGGTLVALGTPSDGHVDLVDDLRQLADDLGLGLEITGYLSDADLLERAGQVAVPICAHRHVSASGTIGTWMAAGRVPVVQDGPYARAVQQRCPAALVLASDLTEAIAGAAADPAGTVLPADVVVGPTTEQAAAEQRRLLQDWLAA